MKRSALLVWFVLMVTMRIQSTNYDGNQLRLLRAACTDEYRKIDGKTEDLTPLFQWIQLDEFGHQPMSEWTFLVGKVVQVLPKGLLLAVHPHVDVNRETKVVHLVNYPHASVLVDGDGVAVAAKQIGRFQYSSVLGALNTVDSFDYGTPADPEEIKKRREARRDLLAKQQAAELAAKAEEVRKADKRNVERLAQNDKVALEFQIKRAAARVASAQFDLGVRYLEGKGVERDMERAKWLLADSAKQGYAPAIKKLKTIE